VQRTLREILAMGPNRLAPEIGAAAAGLATERTLRRLLDSSLVRAQYREP
jgi:hypothetical protein